MFRLALLLLISTAVYADDSTSSAPCNKDFHGEVSFTMSTYGETLDVNPLLFQKNCPGFHNDQKDNFFVRVTGPVDSNFYVLFTKTNLRKNEKVYIYDEKMAAIAECEGDDDSDFCAPIILLKRDFYLRIPLSVSENDLKIVVVSTTKIPYSYYAYSQLPAWATVVTVFVTFMFLFLMTLMCCCCMLMMCRRRRRVPVVTSCPHGIRTVPDGPPVYSTANPVVFDIPPSYMEHEEAPVLPQKSH